MIKKEIESVIKERSKISKETQDNWADGIEKCWEKEICILTKNISETIKFFKNDCTAEEFSWLSEVFDDIAEKSQSKKFVECIKEIAKKFPEECKKYNINNCIEHAENTLI